MLRASGKLFSKTVRSAHPRRRHLCRIVAQEYDSRKDFQSRVEEESCRGLGGGGSTLSRAVEVGNEWGVHLAEASVVLERVEDAFSLLTSSQPG